MKSSLKFCLTAFICIALFASCKSKKVESTEIVTNNVEFTFLQTVQYCGGAAPPDELIEKLETPSPIHKQAVYFKSLDTKEVVWTKQQLDTHVVNVELAPGRYEIYLNTPETIHTYLKIMGIKVNKCSVDWFSRKLAGVTIAPGESNKTIIIHYDCNPCMAPRP